MSPAACLILWLAAAGAVASPDLDATAAFGGRFLPAAATDVSVRIGATAGGAAEVVAATDRAVWRTTVELDRGRPVTAHLPVVPGDDGVVRIRVWLDGQPGLEQRLTLRAAERRLRVLAVAGGAARLEQPLSGITLASAASLPVFPQAYEMVDAIVVDRQMLAAMDDARLEALKLHVANCGRTGLLAAPAAVVEQLRTMAGCGGEGLGFVATSAEAVAFLAAGTPAPALPSPASLRHVPDPPDGAARAPQLLLALAALSLFAVLALAAGGATAGRLALAPAAASLLMLAAGSAVPPNVVQVTWAEAVSGDVMARFVTLVHVTGGAPGSIPVPVTTGWPDLSDQPASRIEAAGPAFDRPRLITDTALLQHRQLAFRGVRSLSVPLRLDSRNGMPRITNPGPQGATGALLSWQDREYPVPPLPPGGVWSPDPDSAGAPDSAMRRLLRARTVAGAPALIVPFHHRQGVIERGWLLVRAAGGPPT